jgi:hypothetical protein
MGLTREITSSIGGVLGRKAGKLVGQRIEASRSGAEETDEENEENEAGESDDESETDEDRSEEADSGDGPESEDEEQADGEPEAESGSGSEDNEGGEDGESDDEEAAVEAQQSFGDMSDEDLQSFANQLMDELDRRDAEQ